MRLRVVPLVCAALLALVGSPAVAVPEPPLGTRIPRWDGGPRASDRDAARVLRDFGRCVVRTQPGSATLLLRTLPESQEERGAIRTLVGRPTSCLSAARMMLNSVLFRGSIAEGFLVRAGLDSLPLLPPAPVEEFASYSTRLSAADVDGVDQQDRAIILGGWLAACVAREQPQLVVPVLKAAPLSREEQAALRAAEGAFSTCLPSGQVLRVDRFSIRALLAEALYHRVRASGSSGAD